MSGVRAGVYQVAETHAGTCLGCAFVFLPPPLPTREVVGSLPESGVRGVGPHSGGASAPRPRQEQVSPRQKRARLDSSLSSTPSLPSFPPSLFAAQGARPCQDRPRCKSSSFLLSLAHSPCLPRTSPRNSTLRPPAHRDFLSSHPGIPESAGPSPSFHPPVDPLVSLPVITRAAAHLSGTVEVRPGNKAGGTKAKWLRVELEKIETIPAQQPAGTAGGKVKEVKTQARFVELIGNGPGELLSFLFTPVYAWTDEGLDKGRCGRPRRPRRQRPPWTLSRARGRRARTTTKTGGLRSQR